METRTYTVYKFHELPENVQEKAIEKLSDINVDYEWWDFVYEDANTVGLEITGFDIYHGTIDGNLILSVADCICAIYKHHGKTCETYKTAQRYRKEAYRLEKLVNQDDIANENLMREFKYDLLEDYLTILRKECEYLTSREAIIETIEANNYDFTEDGKID